MALIRLDKILAQQSMASRKDVKNLIRSGAVEVNGKIVKESDTKIDLDKDKIFINKQQIVLKEYTYIMMNKPAGVVSATQDAHTPTVIDILPNHLKRKDLFPAGRLDKDTVGFVLITDDGEFAHNILSPKKHVEKTYLAKLDKQLTLDIIPEFEKGVDIGQGEVCLPAKLRILENSQNPLVEVKIKQGMYHQIKRMFLSYGYKVIYLQRTQIGNLPLDVNLKEGEARELSKEELEAITTTALDR